MFLWKTIAKHEKEITYGGDNKALEVICTKV